MSAAPDAPLPTPGQVSRRWTRRLLVLLAVLTALVAATWWGVPALIKSQLPPQLSTQLGRPVSLADARFNPWRMALDLQGLRIGAAATAAAEAPPLLQIDLLQIDLNLPLSLRHRAPVVDALVIDGLQLRLARTGPGRFDVDDLIGRLAAPGGQTERAEPARFALYNLQLRKGQIWFDDQPVGRQHTVQALTLDLPFLSNLPGDTVIRTQPRLAFQLNGTQFDTGSQALPFAETRTGDLRLAFADLDLAPWLPYLPDTLPVRLQAGRLGSDLRVHFKLPPQGTPTVAIQGNIGLRDVVITEPGGAPLVAWQALTLGLQDVQPLARQVGLGPLNIDGLVINLSRNLQGLLNVQQLQAPRSVAGSAPMPAIVAASAPAAAVTVAPVAGVWRLDLAGLQISDAQLRWRDDSLRPAATYTLDKLSLQAQALRWPDPQPVPLTLAAVLHQGGASGPVAATIAAEGQLTDRQATISTTLDSPDLATLAPYFATALKPRIGGRLAAKASVRWAAAPAALAIQVDEATVQGLQLHDGQGRKAPLLAGLQRLQLGGVEVDLLGRQVAVGSVRIDQPTVQVQRLADGQMDLAPWLPAAAPAGTARAAVASGSAAPGPGWRIALKSLALQDGRVAWADAAVGAADGPLQAELTGLKIRLQGLDWPARPNAALPRLQLQARIGAPPVPGTPPMRGGIDWSGRFGLAPLQAEGRLQLDRLPVHLFMPYAGDTLPASLQHADASLSTQLRALATPAGWQLSTDGGLQITEVLVHTRPAPGDAAGSELLRWESLALQGLSLALQPTTKPRVEVRELTLNDFYSRLIITEQGRFNLQDVAANAPAGDTAAAATAAASAPSPQAPPVAAAASGLPIDLVLGQTTLRNGSIDFSDRFVRPNYSARLTELNGSIGTIRSGTRDMATISLRGRAADTALLDISGQLNPTAEPLALDIRAKATDLELAPLSPYAGKYAGYAIERGKLSMDVSYKIDADGKLAARNQVILNQLTFGERVESPSATQLPVLLAVALLKDRHGVIDIDLPVSGTLNDPQFSVGGIIWKLIGNLLVKALTSPFALLSGGGSDDLSQVQFTAGTAQITAEGQQALAKVASALSERPSLMMTVTGAADAVAEREQARRSLLDDRLAAASRLDRLRATPAARPIAASAPASGASAPPPQPLTAAERAAALKRLYQQTPLPDRPRNLVNQLKDIPPAEMESRLLAAIPVTDETMQALALQRGLAVRDALIARGLPSARLFLAAPKLRSPGQADAAWVPSVQLTLSVAK